MTSITDRELDEVELIALTQQLVRIPSPQTELMEAEPAVQQTHWRMRRGPRGPRTRGSPLHGKPVDRDRAKLGRSCPHIMAYTMNHLPPPETLYSHGAFDADFW
jgi:hypothetical protein